MYSMLRFSRRLFLASSAFGAAAWMASRWAIADEGLDDSPDRRTDAEFLQHGIKEISDEDLFAAMDLSKPELKSIQEAVEKRDYPAAYRAWGEHWNAVAPARSHFVGEGNLVLPRDQAIRSLEPR